MIAYPLPHDLADDYTCNYGEIAASIQYLLGATLNDSWSGEILACLQQFDPVFFTQYPDEYTDYGFAELNEYIDFAIRICREYFPAVYADVLDAQRVGASNSDLETIISSGIGAYINVDVYLDFIPAGVPFQLMGVDLYDYEAIPDDLLTIYRWFGINDADDWSSVEAAHLVWSLQEQTAPVYQQLAFLVQWLFKISGNTAVDMDMEEWQNSEINYPEWDEFELIADMQAEADEIISAAWKGVAALQNNWVLATWFRYNIRSILDHDTNPYHVYWPKYVGNRQRPEPGGRAHHLQARHVAQKVHRQGRSRVSRRPGSTRQNHRPTTIPQDRIAHARRVTHCRAGRSAHRRRVSSPTTDRHLGAWRRRSVPYTNAWFGDGAPYASNQCELSYLRGKTASDGIG